MLLYIVAALLQLCCSSVAALLQLSMRTHIAVCGLVLRYTHATIIRGLTKPLTKPLGMKESNDLLGAILQALASVTTPPPSQALASTLPSGGGGGCHAQEVRGDEAVGEEARGGGGLLGGGCHALGGGGGGGSEVLVVSLLESLTDLIRYGVTWPRLEMGSWVRAVQASVLLTGRAEQPVRRSAAGTRKTYIHTCILEKHTYTYVHVYVCMYVCIYICM
jgi:hypothetical protein